MTDSSSSYLANNENAGAFFVGLSTLRILLGLFIFSCSILTRDDFLSIGEF